MSLLRVCVSLWEACATLGGRVLCPRAHVPFDGGGDASLFGGGGLCVALGVCIALGGRGGDASLQAVCCSAGCALL